MLLVYTAARLEFQLLMQCAQPFGCSLQTRCTNAGLPCRSSMCAAPLLQGDVTACSGEVLAAGDAQAHQQALELLGWQ